MRVVRHVTRICPTIGKRDVYCLRQWRCSFRLVANLAICFRSRRCDGDYVDAQNAELQDVVVALLVFAGHALAAAVETPTAGADEDRLAGPSFRGVVVIDKSHRADHLYSSDDSQRLHVICEAIAWATARI